MARSGPFYPDTRPGRRGVIHFPNGRTSGPGTVWCESDNPEQMADAFNRAYEAGREAARADVRNAIGMADSPHG